MFLSILLLGILAQGAFSGKIDSLLNSDGIFENMGFDTLSADPLVSLTRALSNPLSVSKAYSNFLKKQNKTGDSTPKRKSIFKSNLLTIAAHNTKARNGKAGYELGVNQFTDLTSDEVIQDYTGYSSDNDDDNHGSSIPETEKLQSLSRQSRATPPQSIDWRHYGLVTPVKNQGQCGSCVMFSVTGCLESYWSLTNGQKQIDLAEQELLDCAQGSQYPGNAGCNGNNFPATFKYIRDTGETTEGEYRYQERQTSCQSGKSHPAKTPGFWSIQSGNENALREAVGLRGPVSVAIHVNDALMRYKSGIFEAPCSGGRNHAVLVVGYGNENGRDFWIVKNSWGEGWGAQGYFKLRRNYGNLCDIAGDAVSCNPNVEIALG